MPAGEERKTRVPLQPEHAITVTLSYASMNWIRFEGSLCRAARRAYQPLSPLPGLP